jgi:hypothetical protein
MFSKVEENLGGKWMARDVLQKFGKLVFSILTGKLWN